MRRRAILFPLGQRQGQRDARNVPLTVSLSWEEKASSFWITGCAGRQWRSTRHALNGERWRNEIMLHSQ
jgi:hypothetical protein